MKNVLFHEAPSYTKARTVRPIVLKYFTAGHKHGRADDCWHFSLGNTLLAHALMNKFPLPSVPNVEMLVVVWLCRHPAQCHLYAQSLYISSESSPIRLKLDHGR